MEEGGRRVLIRIKNPKFLDWPNRGTPGSKWVTFMLPDVKKGIVGSTRLLAQYAAYMDGFTGNLSAQKKKEKKKKAAEHRCRPLREA